MAIKPDVSYPGQVEPASPAYPWGGAKDETVPGAEDGTPVKQSWLSDVWGFLQGLLKTTDITPTGTPDTAIASQYRDAIGIMSASNSRPIGVLSNNIATPNYKLDAEADIIWDSGFTTLMKTTATFTKDIGQVWMAGNGNGGRPSTIALPVDTWLHFFKIMNSTTGAVDYGWSDTLDASKLLADSGYDLYRYKGSNYFTSAGFIASFKQVGNVFYVTVRELSYKAFLTTAYTTITLALPQNVILEAKVLILVNPADNQTNGIFFRHTGTTLEGRVLEVGGNNFNIGTTEVSLLIDGTASIEHKRTGPDLATYNINVRSYKDFLVA